MILTKLVNNKFWSKIKHSFFFFEEKIKHSCKRLISNYPAYPASSVGVVKRHQGDVTWSKTTPTWSKTQPQECSSEGRRATAAQRSRWWRLPAGGADRGVARTALPSSSSWRPRRSRGNRRLCGAPGLHWGWWRIGWIPAWGHHRRLCSRATPRWPRRLWGFGWVFFVMPGPCIGLAWGLCALFPETASPPRGTRRRRRRRSYASPEKWVRESCFVCGVLIDRVYFSIYLLCNAF